MRKIDIGYAIKLRKLLPRLRRVAEQLAAFRRPRGIVVRIVPVGILKKTAGGFRDMVDQLPAVLLPQMFVRNASIPEVRPVKKYRH
jgi:hypothetical protein